MSDKPAEEPPKPTEEEKAAPEISDKHAKKKAEKEAKAAAKKAEKEARKQAAAEAAEGGAPVKSEAELAKEKKQERLAKRQEQSGAAKKEDDPSANFYGDLPLNRSQSDPEKRYEKVFTNVQDITAEKVGQEVLIRGRAHAVTGKGSIAFVIVRQGYYTVQATASVGETISKGMIKFLQKVNKESIVDVLATVAEADVQKTTQK